MTTETIPCRLCGLLTPMLGTKLCDRCWELESRIENDPALAIRILKPTSDSKQAAFEAMREALRVCSMFLSDALPPDNRLGDIGVAVRHKVIAAIALADAIQNEEP